MHDSRDLFIFRVIDLSWHEPSVNTGELKRPAYFYWMINLHRSTLKAAKVIYLPRTHTHTQFPKVRLAFHPPFPNFQTSNICWFRKEFISRAEPHLQAISVMVVVVESAQDQTQRPITISASLHPGQGIFSAEVKLYSIYQRDEISWFVNNLNL